MPFDAQTDRESERVRGRRVTATTGADGDCSLRGVPAGLVSAVNLVAPEAEIQLDGHRPRPVQRSRVARETLAVRVSAAEVPHAVDFSAGREGDEKIESPAARDSRRYV
ncbi:MAG: hypothetical protein M3N13_07615 [Candidatus Eremiobacteraeota bacterium]|nr:hypothetical protein [Candidatus Eremiobacteraeota bacterium]